MSVVFPSEEGLSVAAGLLRSGGIVAIPTETVYGLAANAFDARAVARIFAAKARPAFDPLIVHVLDDAMLARVAAGVDPRARRLIERFWPGPLTIVFEKRAQVPPLVTSGADTVAVRSPAHPVARELLRRTNQPLAAPSANPFGRLSPTRAHHVAEMLGDRIDLIVDGGASVVGIESTIVALSPRLTVLRPGAVTVEALADATGEAPYVPPASSDAGNVPGRIEHHYAPRTPLRIVNPDRVALHERANAALVTLDRPVEGYARVRVLSARGDLIEAAAALFDALHELDAAGLERIDVAPFPESGLGAAIVDRLRRAAARSSV